MRIFPVLVAVFLFAVAFSHAAPAVAAVALGGVLLTIYMAPTLWAYSRGVRGAGLASLAAFNLFIGWTHFGWIVVGVMAYLRVAQISHRSATAALDQLASSARYAAAALDRLGAAANATARARPDVATERGARPL